MFTLETPPTGVDQALWAGGGLTPRPEVGDLWLISWDGVALALGVVSRVASSFVLCWPVTLTDAEVFAPALTVDSSPLEVPVLVWPTRETGVGTHMLHRRFGQLLTAKTIALVDVALDEESGGVFPLPLTQQTIEGEAAELASDSMLDLWEGICLNVWPEAVPGESPFSVSVMRTAGLQVADLADTLGVPLPVAVSLMRGENIPTIEQVEAVAVR